MVVEKLNKNNRLLVRLLCAVIIFVSGIAIGTGGTILMVKHRVIWISKAFRDPNSITQTIRKKYDLNPQQTIQVQQLITAAFEQKRIDDEAQSAKREVYAQSMIADMNEILTPEQFENWSRDFQELRGRYKKRK